MAGRRIRDITDARECLAEVARTGLHQAEWCRAQGIDGRSLQAWRMNLGGRSARQATATSMKLVELVPDRGVPSGQYIIRVGVMSIEVAPGFDERGLRRLLAVVSSC